MYPKTDLPSSLTNPASAVNVTPKPLLFTPPMEDASKLPRYASYVVGSGMKLHHRVGDAKNSWRNRGWETVPDKDREPRSIYNGEPMYWRKSVTKHAFILENVEGRWFTLYEIAPGLSEAELPWMKEFVQATGGYEVYYRPMSDYYRESVYWKERFEKGTAEIVKRAVPMSIDQYVSWRLRVENELRASTVRRGSFQ